MKWIRLGLNLIWHSKVHRHKHLDLATSHDVVNKRYLLGIRRLVEINNTVPVHLYWKLRVSLELFNFNISKPDLGVISTWIVLEESHIDWFALVHWSWVDDCQLEINFLTLGVHYFRLVYGDQLKILELAGDKEVLVGGRGPGWLGSQFELQLLHFLVFLVLLWHYSYLTSNGVLVTDIKIQFVTFGRDSLWQREVNRSNMLLLLKVIKLISIIYIPNLNRYRLLFLEEVVKRNCCDILWVQRVSHHLGPSNLQFLALSDCHIEQNHGICPWAMVHLGQTWTLES